MSIRNLIILSQLNPPAPRNHVLVRERVNHLLDPALNFPLTLLRAGTGYGKSTALISFINKQSTPVFWYTVSGPDRDPTLFLAKLFSAFNQHGASLGGEALRILELPESSQQEAMIVFVNSLATHLSEDTLLVLDDFHLVREDQEVMRLVDWLVNNLPVHLHLLISTRRTLDFLSFNKWQVKGMLLEISAEDLAFDHSEISELFDTQYGVHLDPNEIQQLHEKTKGWAIGLQMIWQTLKGDPEKRVQKILEDDQDSRKTLFAYLAEEVLGRLDPHLQEFLITTSILSELDSETCDFLILGNDSMDLLTQFHHTGFFIEELRPGVYRYHHLFKEFLLSHLNQNPEIAQLLHRKVASYFSAHQYWERAISHLLSDGDYHQVNQVLEAVGVTMIQAGRRASAFGCMRFQRKFGSNIPSFISWWEKSIG